MSSMSLSRNPKMPYMSNAMNDATTIKKLAALGASEDYTALRKEGIDLIEQLGRALWTDFNIHDPGITLLELLCYAETEIGYKLGFSVEDLLARHPAAPQDPADDAASQCFYTAREILTCNPWTPGDFRKLCIDLEGVRNAWLLCKDCRCGVPIYASCKDSVLQYARTEHPVRIRGFNDVLVELDVNQVYGDLNSGKVISNLQFASAGRFSKATMEMRFPPYHRAEDAIPAFDDLLPAETTIEQVTASSIAASKNQVVDVPETDLYRALHRVLYATLVVEYRIAPAAPIQQFTLTDVPLRVWYRSDDDRRSITIADLRQLLEDTGSGGVIPRYTAQLREADSIMHDVTAAVHAHRNLAEDFCSITTVPVEDIGICADITMTGDADIEEVLGEAYRQISQYFNPPVPMYSLREMLAMGEVTEDIFNGPELDHGFIRNEELDASSLRSHLYASDVINILMDIEGVTAVANLTLVRYDDEGTLVESQPWELAVTAGHLPRLYIHGSKVLVYKNELPFLPDPDELNDALQLQNGKDATGKQSQQDNDFPVPTGSWVDNSSMLALQESLPETYGISSAGLPEHASDARRGKAKQLRAYLMVFEHVLSVYLRQLSHFRDMLTIDVPLTAAGDHQTYFPQVLTDTRLKGAGEIYDSMSDVLLHSFLETPASAVQRRNLFLDHLLARFAESFADYALMLHTAIGSEMKTGEQLIADKVHFLEQFSLMSHDRGKAFNYRNGGKGCESDEIAGLERRIRVLLGLKGENNMADDADNVFVVEHILLRPRNAPSALLPDGDPLLTICIPPDCSFCGEQDPYSFRLTIVINGEGGFANSGMEFRRFAERSIREEVPAHLAVKICWVSKEQLTAFESVYCAWLKELSREEVKPLQLHARLVELLEEFVKLKSVYPTATLHDCVDGDDENRIYLNNTSI
ncbi:hypothetical protein KQI65_15600 [bacterium]|nr:hypothetical protein [bacterium]